MGLNLRTSPLLCSAHNCWPSIHDPLRTLGRNPQGAAVPPPLIQAAATTAARAWEGLWRRLGRAPSAANPRRTRLRRSRHGSSESRAGSCSSGEREPGSRRRRRAFGCSSPKCGLGELPILTALYSSPIAQRNLGRMRLVLELVLIWAGRQGETRLRWGLMLIC
jgi:hypothetical protein